MKLFDAINQFKREYIIGVLRNCKGNQSTAAKELGVHRNTLIRMIEVLGIDAEGIRNQFRIPRLIQSLSQTPSAIYQREWRKKLTAQEDRIRQGM